ncbi:MAG: SUMF1/EgtB/PvdO family nonheme iron enzyme [Ardenticatenia bacterium]|nr:SUMF1/EgtB/PvdO family nonheme iron enzyme [Ardenticatenia bacterium]
MTLGDAAFEAALNIHYRPTRQVEPAFWRDARLNAASQPVVGVCWYEARAYCAWLSAQAGLAFSLPTEVQWEAAVRGADARLYPWGDDFDPTRANTFETRIRRTTPVGAFPEGDSASGVADGAGNVDEWTSSLWGLMEDADRKDPEFGYPYDSDDGRENFDAPPSAARVLRGGSWYDFQYGCLAAARNLSFPAFRLNFSGFRVVGASSNLPEPLASGAA